RQRRRGRRAWRDAEAVRRRSEVRHARQRRRRPAGAAARRGRRDARRRGRGRDADNDGAHDHRAGGGGPRDDGGPGGRRRRGRRADRWVVADDRPGRDARLRPLVRAAGRRLASRQGERLRPRPRRGRPRLRAPRALRIDARRTVGREDGSLRAATGGLDARARLRLPRLQRRRRSLVAGGRRIDRRERLFRARLRLGGGGRRRAPASTASLRRRRGGHRVRVGSVGVHDDARLHDEALVIRGRTAPFVLALVLGAAPACAPDESSVGSVLGAGEGLAAAYFAGRDFQRPSGVYQDANIDFDGWQLNDLVQARGHFAHTVSIRWTGQIWLEDPGSYTLFFELHGR